MNHPVSALTHTLYEYTLYCTHLFVCITCNL